MAIEAQLYPENIGLPFCGSQDWMDDNASGIGGFNESYSYFNLQQHQQQKQPPYMHLQQHLQIPQLQQRSQNFSFRNSALRPRNNSSMASLQRIATRFENQGQDIDRFIRLENDRLRLALHEQRKKELAMVLKEFESKAQFLLGQKDEEMAQAVNKARELEGCLKIMEIESQTWQRLAKEKEATVLSLNNTIEQLREIGYLASTNGAQDAESWCDNNRGDQNQNDLNCNYEAAAGENIDDDYAEQEERMRKMVCKSCNSRESCVIFLPCRHLCSCKPCESFLDCCPVCGVGKKASIEALI